MDIFSLLKVNLCSFFFFLPVNICYFIPAAFSFHCFILRFNAVVIDGHNIEEILKALDTAQNVKGKPTAIIAKTYKGKGLQGEMRIYLGNVILVYFLNYILHRLQNSLYFISQAAELITLFAEHVNLHLPFHDLNLSLTISQLGKAD